MAEVPGEDLTGRTADGIISAIRPAADMNATEASGVNRHKQGGAVRTRKLGHTGIEVSELGFGCGSVGGLMIRGDRKEMTRAVAWAIEQGITYFDTARSYGDGQSETNLGAALKELKVAPSSGAGRGIIVGTKITVWEADLGRVEAAVAEQVDEGLRRLGRERVDIVLIHNNVAAVERAGKGRLSPAQVEAAAAGLRKAVAQGKTRTWGINGLGETAAVHAALQASKPGVIQTVYNMLNPSSGEAVPRGYPGQDYAGLGDRAFGAGTGAVAIRVLAAGALSGRSDRHPTAAPNVGPIGTGADYGEDVRRAQAFRFLVDEGIVEDLVEAAIRFAISNGKLSTCMVGLASFEQLEHAVKAANKGPLPKEALGRIRATQESFASGGSSA